MDLIFSISDAMKMRIYYIIYNIVIYQKSLRDNKNSIEECINGKIVCYNPCIVNLAIRHALL
jgi:hypothetical protein